MLLSGESFMITCIGVIKYPMSKKLRGVVSELRIVGEHHKVFPFHHEVQLWFGFDKESPLVWIQYELKADGSIWLWSIETHPEHRGMGYASQAVQMTKLVHGVKEFCHDGSYTADGLAFISRKLDWKSKREPAQEYDSLVFVDEWNVDYTH